MAFILPSQYRTADQVPVPNNAAVKVTNVPAHTVAAITFKGYMSSQQADKERELRAACATDGIGLSTDPEHVQYCSYNPPWCLPWFRKNEILVRLVDQQWGIRSFALSDDEGDGSPAASPVGG